MSVKKNNEISIKIKATKEGDAIKKTKEEVEELEKSSKEVEESQKDQAKAISETETALSDAGDQAKKAGDHQKKLSEETKKSTTATSQQTKETEQLSEQQKKAAQEAKIAADQQAALKAQLDKANAQMAASAAANGAMATAISGMGGAAGESAPNFGAAALGITQMMMAIKAGMGPMGWLLMAIQGAQIALDVWQSKAKKASDQSIEESQRIGEQIKALRDLAAELGGNERDARLEKTSAAIADNFRKIEEAATQYRDRSTEAMAAQDAASSHQLAMISDQHEAAKALLAIQQEAGELSAAEAQAKIADLEMLYAKEAAALEDLSARRRLKYAEDVKDQAEAQAEAMQQALQSSYGQYEAIAAFKLPSEEDIAILEGRLNRIEDFSEREQAAILAEEKSLLKMGQDIRKSLRPLGVSLDGGWKETMEFVRALQEQRVESEALVAKKREESKMQDEIIVQMKSEIERAHERAESEAQLLELSQKRAAAQAKARDAAASEQKAIAENTKRQQELSAALSELLGNTQTSVNYTQQDHRTQTEIWEADKKLLLERERQLLALRSTSGMDVGLMKQVNASLRGTRDSLKAIEKTMLASRPQAQRFLEDLSPLNVKASSKLAQRNIDAMAESYNKLSKSALRAAQNGDDKALARYQHQLQRLAGNMERVSGYSGHALDQHRAVNEALEKVARTTVKGLEGETAKERQIRKSKEELGQELTARERSRKAAEDAAKAQQDVANQAKRSSQGSKAKDQAVQLADLQGQVKVANASVQAMTDHVAQLQSVLTQQNALIGQLTSGMATVVANHNAAVSNQTKRINELSAKIAQMKRS